MPRDVVCVFQLLFLLPVTFFSAQARASMQERMRPGTQLDGTVVGCWRLVVGCYFRRVSTEVTVYVHKSPADQLCKHAPSHLGVELPRAPKKWALPSTDGVRNMLLKPQKANSTQPNRHHRNVDRASAPQQGMSTTVDKPQLRLLRGFSTV